MVGGVLVEHGHRLLGSLVGLLTRGAWPPASWPRGGRLRGLGLVAVVAGVVPGRHRRAAGRAARRTCWPGARLPGPGVLRAPGRDRAWSPSARDGAVRRAGRRPRGWRPSTLAAAVARLRGRSSSARSLTHGRPVELAPGGALAVFDAGPGRHGACCVRHAADAGPAPGGRGPCWSCSASSSLLGVGAYLVRFTSVWVPGGQLAVVALPVLHRAWSARSSSAARWPSRSSWAPAGPRRGPRAGGRGARRARTEARGMTTPTAGRRRDERSRWPRTRRRVARLPRAGEAPRRPDGAGDTSSGTTSALSGAPDYVRLRPPPVGTALAAGGTLALNQFWERDVDARMHRTRERPLPDGRLAAGRGAAFGALMTVGGPGRPGRRRGPRWPPRSPPRPPCSTFASTRRSSRDARSARCWARSRRAAAGGRLGGRPGRAGRRRLGALRHPVPLAAAAHARHRAALPRGLRARRRPACCRWSTPDGGSTERQIVTGCLALLRGRPAADAHRARRRRLLLRRPRCSARSSWSFGAPQALPPSQPARARVLIASLALPAAPAGAPGPGQGMTRARDGRRPATTRNRRPARSSCVWIALLMLASAVVAWLRDPLVSRARRSSAARAAAASDRPDAAGCRRRRPPRGRRRRRAAREPAAAADLECPPGHADAPRSAETMFFGGLVSRSSCCGWRRRDVAAAGAAAAAHRADGLNTLVLLASSCDARAALRGVRRRRQRGARAPARAGPGPGRALPGSFRATSGRGSSTSGSRRRRASTARPSTR